MDIQPGHQVRIVLAGLFPALVGEGQQEGQRGVAKCQGRGARDGARHVGDAVVHDAIDIINRVLVRGGFRGLEAAALIDGDVDKDRTGLHRLELGAGDQFRGCGPRDQDCADHHVGVGDKVGGVASGRIDRLEVASEDIVEIAQARQRAVEDGHVRAHACGNLGSMGADHAAADDDDLAGGHAGHAAEQHAAAAVGLLQGPCADLRAQGGPRLRTWGPAAAGRPRGR